jgi:ribosomal-protein-alanine N-acetyltransferase
VTGVGSRTAALRQMTVDDLPAVMAIERAVFPSDAWSEGMMRGELADQPRSRHYLVAVEEAANGQGGEITGYAGIAAAADQADVQTIVVRPDRRRLGVGRALLAALLAEAARRGAREIFLEVRTDNMPAQVMYERFGFHRIGLRRHYYEDGTDAYTMKRRLPLTGGGEFPTGFGPAGSGHDDGPGRA